jgi:amino acid transporter
MSRDRLGWNGTFTMAVGGMVGGGIFSVLGVVVGLAGSLAWVSFVLAGVVALLAALCYVALTTGWHTGGGSYGFLRHVGHEGAAANLAWVLVAGYVLTVSVYAFTFGHYLANVLGLDPALWARVAAAVIIAVLVVVNLRGVGDSQVVEEWTVWGKLVVLAVLAGIGLVRFDAAALAPEGGASLGVAGVFVGAAAIFMAYEGFQLLTYDYDDIEEPDRVLPRAVPPAVVAVTLLYVAVALGAASLVGGQALVEEKEIALASAGEEAAGTVGLVVVTVAAVFATGSAINATLFATARLARSIASDGHFPGWVGHANGRGVPDRAIIVLGAVAAVLAVAGSLGTLVEAASLVFLATFATVCALAAWRDVGPRLVAVAGAVGSTAAVVLLTWRLATETPYALAGLALVVVATLVVRPKVSR